MGGSEDSKIYIWDLQSREVLQVLEGHRGISLVTLCLSGSCDLCRRGLSNCGERKLGMSLS